MNTDLATAIEITEWDKLWDTLPETELWRAYIPSYFLSKIKAEGDKLQIRNEGLALDRSFKIKKLEAIRTLNVALYYAIPRGKIDSFELIKLIGSHYEKVAEVLGE